MGLSDFGGRFVEYDIDFHFDETDMQNSKIEVSIPVASIDTYSPELNSKMPNTEFFDVAQYPTIRFVSTAIEQIADDKARMDGDMTIKGVTLPISFDVTYKGKVMHPYYKINNAGFSATATLDSRAFGVNPLPEWMLGSEVRVRIEMEAFEGNEVPYYNN